MAGRRYYGDWASLTAAAKQAAEEILLKDVAPVSEKILKRHIKSDIYSYPPPKPHGWVNGTTYVRRHVLEKEITSYMESADTMVTTSTADASTPVVKGYSFVPRMDGAFLLMLELGDMGFWNKYYPRPAVYLTQQEINSSADIVNAIKKGIKTRFGAVE